MQQTIYVCSISISFKEYLLKIKGKFKIKNMCKTFRTFYREISLKFWKVCRHLRLYSSRTRSHDILIWYKHWTPDNAFSVLKWTCLHTYVYRTNADGVRLQMSIKAVEWFLRRGTDNPIVSSHGFEKCLWNYFETENLFFFSYYVSNKFPNLEDINKLLTASWKEILLAANFIRQRN